jgi:hypothetical protein
MDMARTTLLTAILLTAAVFAEPPRELLEKGIFQLEVVRNPGAARVIFEQVAKLRREDPSAAAEARVWLGRMAAPPGALPQPIAAEATGRERQEASAATEAKLRAIVLPEIRFEGTSIADALHQIRELSRASDKNGGGVNLVWIPGPPDEPEQAGKPGLGKGSTGLAGFDRGFGPAETPQKGDEGNDKGKPPTGNKREAEATRTIRLELTDTTLADALNCLCLQMNLHSRIEPGRVLVGPRDVALEPMETRFYHMAPGVLDARRTRPRSLSFDSGDDDDDDDNDDDDDDDDDNGYDRYMINVDEFFANLGVSFPRGSRILYPPSGKLLVHNTPSEHEKIRRILMEINPVPANVRLEVELLEVLDPALLRDLRANALSAIALRALPGDALRTLIRLSGVTLSGKRMPMQALFPQPPTARSKKDAVGAEDATPAGPPGVLFEILPTVASDNYSIDVELDLVLRGVPAGDTGFLSGQRFSAKTGLIVWDGESAAFMLSGGDQVDSRSLFLIVTAVLLDPAGLPLRPRASEAEERNAVRRAVSGGR